MTRSIALQGEIGTKRKGRRRVVLAALLLLLAVLGGWAYRAVSLLDEGRARAESARDTLTALTEVEPLDADLEDVRNQLQEGTTEIAAARRALSSRWLAPIAPMPIAGRQLASARALAHGAEAVLRSVTPAVDRVVESGGAGDPASQRMDMLRGLEDDLLFASRVIGDVDLGPDEALIAPLAEARSDAKAHLVELGASIDRALAVVRGVRALLDSSTYLILAANPAEMGNAGGLFLSVGELHAEGGDLALDEFRHASELFPLPPVEAANVDVDVRDRWAHLSPGDDFRKLNLTPRFAAYTGPVSLAMWQSATGTEADGAIAVDPVVVQALLEVVGGVEVGGQVYDSENLLSYALVEQYIQFGGDGDQQERRELVTQIARAAVAAMGERSWDPVDLIRALRGPAQGRHLLAYSDDPVQQAMWSTIGVDGHMDGDEVLVNVASLGGQKTDGLLEVEVEAEVGQRAHDHLLRLAITVTNHTPTGIGGFAAGVVESVGEEAGTYIGRLVLFTPSGTRHVALSPPAPLEAAGRDGPLVVTATRLTLEPGATQQFAVDVLIDGALPSLTVVPSGRVPPVSWTIDGKGFSDAQPHVVPLG